MGRSRRGVSRCVALLRCRGIFIFYLFYLGFAELGSGRVIFTSEKLHFLFQTLSARAWCLTGRPGVFKWRGIGPLPLVFCFFICFIWGFAYSDTGTGGFKTCRPDNAQRRARNMRPSCTSAMLIRPQLGRLLSDTGWQPRSVKFTRENDSSILIGDPAQTHANGVETKPCTLSTVIKPVVMMAVKASEHTHTAG